MKKAVKKRMLSEFNFIAKEVSRQQHEQGQQLNSHVEPEITGNGHVSYRKSEGSKMHKY